MAPESVVVSRKLSAAARPSIVLPESPLTGELEVRLPAGCRFGVCLTHDIDHLGLREHFVDGFLVRYAGNVVRQNLFGRFRPIRLVDGLAGIAMAGVGVDRWDTVGELLEAEQRAGVRATWFCAVRKGLGIAYDHAALGETLKTLRDAGHEIGLHGQSHDDGDALAAEVSDLESLAGTPIQGLRMHYLRLSSSTLDGMQKAGLSYDSTTMDRTDMDPATHKLPAPIVAREGLLEVPLHVMDSTLFSVTGLAFGADEAIAYTRRLFARAEELGRVVTINLHPNAYSRQDPDTRAWFDAVLDDVTKRSDVFVTDMRGLVANVETA
jgi:peptidoglycan/xylan/chitin deacetylase (PgdA/CDA1 family)